MCGGTDDGGGKLTELSDRVKAIVPEHVGTAHINGADFDVWNSAEDG